MMIENILINAGLYFLIAWWFTSFEPLQLQLFNFSKYIEEKGKMIWKLLYVQFFYGIVKCHYCLSFWVALIASQCIITALIASFAAYTYQKWLLS